MADYDVIIVGGGHNGLTTGGYLAKEGLDVLVCEQRPIVGGACVTEEWEPGFKFNLGATGLIGWLQPKVEQDLELRRFGFEPIPVETLFTSMYPDGNYLTIYPDLEKARKEIARFSEKDADTYVEFMEKWGKLKAFMGPALLNPPAPMNAMSSAIGLSEEMMDMMKNCMFGTLRSTLDKTFETDYLKNALMVIGGNGLHIGPSANSMMGLIGHLCMTPEWKIAKGGAGAVSQAMAKALEHFGGTIRTDAKIEKIIIRSNKAVGVRLESGEEIFAKAVISNANIKHTYFELVGSDHFDEKFNKKINDIRCEATGMTLHLALDKFPDFMFPVDKIKSSMFAVCPSWQYAEKAWYEYTVNEIPEEPCLFGNVHTYDDPTMAPDGQHSLGMFVYPLPFDLAKGNWDDRRQECFDKAVDVLARYAPNIKDSIIKCDGWTPLDLSREIGLPRGDYAHGMMTLDQMMNFRPPAGPTDYHTPIENLFICGCDAHPGGGVSGAVGHNAAQVIIRDWKAKKVA